MSQLDRVKELCKLSYPKHNWDGHLIPVVNIALELCDQHNADIEIVEPAAYLHDIGRVKFDYLKYIGLGHHLSGYYYSKFRLAGFDCPKDIAEKIALCVLEHSGPGLSRYSPTSLESEVVMNADAISAFEGYEYNYSICNSSNRGNTKKTKIWLAYKLERSWNTKLTLPGVKQELEPLYEKIKEFLKFK